MRCVIFVLAAALASAANISVSVETTPTQALLSYRPTPTSSASCAISLTDPSGATPDDVNAALYANANTDTSHVIVNNGGLRKLTLGLRTAQLALDGRMHSRAFQAATTYSGAISCNSGADTGTFRFTTQTPSLGNSAPDPPPFDANGFGNFAWPTVDFTDQSKSYVDPQTGVLLKRFTKGLSNPYTNTATISYAFDLASAWTSPNNVLGTSGYAQTSAIGQANGLYIPINTGAPDWMANNAAMDIQLALANAWTDGSAVLQFCLYANGQCVSPAQTYALPSTATSFAFPAKWPQVSSYQDWGIVGTLPWDITATTYQQPGTASGATLTLSSYPWFPLNMPAGTRVAVSGSSCPNQVCTVAAQNDQSHVTLTQNIGTLANVNISTLNFGVLIWKQSGSGHVLLNGISAQIAGNAAIWTGYGGDGGTPFCSDQTATWSYAADGVTPIAPQTTVRNCLVQDRWGNEDFYSFNYATGEARLISPLYGMTCDFNGSATHLLCLNIYSDHIVTADYDPNNAAYGHYKDLDATTFTDIVAAAGGYTDLTSADGSDILSQIAVKYPAFDRARFSGPNYSGSYGSTMAFWIWSAQGSATVYCFFDTSLTAPHMVTKCENSWSTYPMRWQVSHGAGIVHGSPYFSTTNTPMEDAGTYNVGRYDLTITSIYNNSGSLALAAGFKDPSSCSALGVTDPTILSLIGSNGCVRINVPRQPLNYSPDTGDRTTCAANGWSPCAYVHNSTACGGDNSTSLCAAYLQDMQVGDWVIDPANGDGGEHMVIGAITPSGNASYDVVLGRAVYSSVCSLSSSSSAQDHSAGFVLTMFAPFSCGPYHRTWISTNDPQGVMYSDFGDASGEAHEEKDISASTYNQIQVNSWTCMTYGDCYATRQVAVPTHFSDPFQYGVRSEYGFNGAIANGFFVQSHPGDGQTSVAPDAAHTWRYDGRPYGPAGGGSTTLWYQSVTLVAGTTHVYHVDVPRDGSGNPLLAVDRKNLATVAWAGRYLLQNISGPGSRITDSTSYAFCYADFANECVSGSTAGNAYVSIPQADTSGACTIQDLSANRPCWTPMQPGVASATQFLVNQRDPLGSYWRPVTQCFNGPGRTIDYDNVHGMPDATWLFCSGTWTNGSRAADLMAALLPSLPPSDGEYRGTFVPHPVSITIPKGATATVRIRFGYDPSTFACIPGNRQEACYTTSTWPGAANPPFLWASEAQKPVTCPGTCSVSIPAFADRVLYYQIGITQNGVETFGPTQVTTVH